MSNLLDYKRLQDRENCVPMHICTQYLKSENFSFHTHFTYLVSGELDIFLYKILEHVDAGVTPGSCVPVRFVTSRGGYFLRYLLGS